ncbi:MAG TPA: hypothetical protein VF647_22920 [Longimicrobium sp.]|jgi:hypothetical protein
MLVKGFPQLWLNMGEVDEFGMQTLEALTTLIRANHYTQALILLYSAIDAVAWASLPSGDVTRSAFCNWADQYMDPQSSLGCSSEDLYAARCSMVHSSTAESKMSREGRARELWYATSPHSIPKLDAHRQAVGSRATVVYFTAMVGAFAEGLMRFSDDLSADPKRQAAANSRIGRWLRFIPMSSVQQAESS